MPAASCPDGVKFGFNVPITDLEAMLNVLQNCIIITVYNADGTRCGAVGQCDNVDTQVTILAGSENVAWQVDGCGDNDDVELICPQRTYTAEPSDLSTCGSAAAFPSLWFSTSSPYSFTVSAASSSISFTCQ